jgi:hypothetical protein
LLDIVAWGAVLVQFKVTLRGLDQLETGLS